jgi:hypothetical protein
MNGEVLRPSESENAIYLRKLLDKISLEDEPCTSLLPSLPQWILRRHAEEERRERTFVPIAPLTKGLNHKRISYIQKWVLEKAGINANDSIPTRGEHYALREPTLRAYRCKPSPLRRCWTNVT